MAQTKRCPDSLALSLARPGETECKLLFTSEGKNSLQGIFFIFKTLYIKLICKKYKQPTSFIILPKIQLDTLQPLIVGLHFRGFIQGTVSRKSEGTNRTRVGIRCIQTGRGAPAEGLLCPKQLLKVRKHGQVETLSLSSHIYNI